MLQHGTHNWFGYLRKYFVSFGNIPQSYILRVRTCARSINKCGESSTLLSVWFMLSKKKLFLLFCFRASTHSLRGGFRWERKSRVEADYGLHKHREFCNWRFSVAENSRSTELQFNISSDDNEKIEQSCKSQSDILSSSTVSHHYWFDSLTSRQLTELEFQTTIKTSHFHDFTWRQSREKRTHKQRKFPRELNWNKKKFASRCDETHKLTYFI